MVINNGLRPVHPGEVLREDYLKPLVRYFGGDVQSWMNLQAAYEVKVTQKNSLRSKS